MASMARYAMEFCAIESCGKCTPCRIGSTRGVEVIDQHRRSGDNATANVALLRDLCDTMVDGSLCALGGMTPFPVLSALESFPEDFRPRRQASRPDGKEHHHEHAYTTYQPPTISARRPERRHEARHAEIDGVEVTVPAGTSVMRAAAHAGVNIPSCAPPTASSRSARAACAWSRSKARKGYPASCTTPVEPGMKVHTQTPKLADSCAAA